MTWIVALVLFAGTSQPPTAPQEKVYVFRLKTTGEVLQGVIVEVRGKVIRIKLDYPWAPETKRIKSIRQEELDGQPVIELPEEREARIKDYYRKHGMVPVSTPNGQVWAPQEDVKLAKRARDMALAVEKAERETAAWAKPLAVPETAKAADPTRPTENVAQGAPHRVLRLGGAAALIVGGLVVIGVIIRSMI